MTGTGAGTGRAAGALRLRPPRNRFDRRVVPWWRVQWLALVLPPVLVLVLLGVLLEPARFWLFLPAALIAVPGLAAALFLPGWWYRVHRWEVTDSAVYLHTGYFWQEWRIAPMSRIQTVDTVRGPLQQYFGLATVVVTTASAKGAVKIEGLDHEVAAELAEQLTQITGATPGDAT
ncbi:PH domain-containing protein [Streptomyces sp. NBC_00237]|uniref:PH domain-containing protein n=1 Tax=Streptomyces sp. NBC_00237 TaxID=2975687 RepID=UPI00225255A1|nr:PH domain-containing protein [Streptomyces sp. NBC_00237]MCX5201959.1 PH domain-containing protein [Streptomyces sp. NBC_00237]